MVLELLSIKYGYRPFPNAASGISKDIAPLFDLGNAPSFTLADPCI